MTTSDRSIERTAILEVQRRLSQAGYEVIVEPHGDQLPEFLRQIQPDAIAIGREPSIAIEVITKNESDESSAVKLDRLRNTLSAYPNWRIEVVYANPSAPSPAIASADEIRHRLEIVREIAKTDSAAGLVMGWSLLEAATRFAVPTRAAKGLTPGTTVEVLASLGYIDQSDALSLRDIGRLRNLVVHGDLRATAHTQQLDRIFVAIDQVIKERLTADSDSQTE